jgi:molybdopterin/thiamine biosynthesis adenylyltransferase
MQDAELLRYSRHIMLPQMDIAGQERLLAATVLIIGVGGLGSPVAMYLAAAGVGRLIVADDDSVELSNLQRQIIHDSTTLGERKVDSARERIKALNPDVVVDTLDQRMGAIELETATQQANVVVDASDNFETRFAINEACHAAAKPLVSGAAIRFEGQVTVFTPGQGDSPCYRCLYPATAAQETCTQNGVLAPLLGIIGSVQATETIKLIAGVGTPLIGRLLLLDALNMEWQSVRLPRDPKCPVCGLPSA